MFPGMAKELICFVNFFKKIGLEAKNKFYDKESFYSIKMLFAG